MGYRFLSFGGISCDKDICFCVIFGSSRGIFKFRIVGYINFCWLLEGSSYGYYLEILFGDFVLRKLILFSRVGRVRVCS